VERGGIAGFKAEEAIQDLAELDLQECTAQRFSLSCRKAGNSTGKFFGLDLNSSISSQNLQISSEGRELAEN
jgi:hypothetical protein